MSYTDFVDRWLTLGTDSKLAAPRGLDPPPALAGQRRPILGEKGIGRLAVAAIGTQVVVLSRARRGRKLSDLTMALVNWRLFEIPGVNLDEVDIPLVELPGGALPRRQDLADLAASMQEQLKKLKLTRAEAKPVRDDLGLLDFDPGALLRYLGTPSLEGRGHGTHFIIVPTSDELPAEIDLAPTGDDKQAPEIVQTLIGFANTMLPNSPKPRIATAFRDRRTGVPPRDLIAPSEFFTPDDFTMADHRVHGEFNVFGDFRGSVSIYGGKAQAYDFVWSKGQRRELECGSFKFDLAYVQGEAKHSRLQPAEHARVTAKLDRIGGLYIYRDDIRVLPYGTPGFDFLGIERRRTQNIGRYFFSYRRMFGVVSLTSAVNSALEEKAGREGFVRNHAYRQFRDVLSEFFVQLAAEFFSTRADREGEFQRGRSEAERRYRARKEHERRTTAARERFARQVGRLLNEIEEGRPQMEAAAAIAELEKTAEGLVKEARTSGRDRLAAAEAEARERVEAARSRFKLNEPPGVGLTPELRRDWEYLRELLLSLDEEVWDPTLMRCSTIVTTTAKRLPAAPTAEERLLAGVGRASAIAEKRIGDAAETAQDALAQAEERVRESVRLSQDAITSATEQAEANAKTPSASSLADSVLAARQRSLERSIMAVADENEYTLRGLADRLFRASAPDGNGSSPAVEGEITGLLEEELLELRERVDRDLELAQLGMATEAISHELDTTIVSIRAALDRLGAYADANPPLRPLTEELRTGFDHLDNYMALFTPLQRRLRRRRALVKGEEIEAFVEGLFGRRLADQETDLRVTDAFRNWELRAFRSTLYPVFVNLVDNASYWVTQNRPPRWIRLDAVGTSLLVSDSGPGVSPRDENVIWDFGFTRKPGGRGAGLHISREVLARDGWQLSLVPSERTAATFRIDPPDATDADA
jgi:signal transduction histidine kinase